MDNLMTDIDKKKLKTLIETAEELINHTQEIINHNSNDNYSDLQNKIFNTLQNTLSTLISVKDTTDKVNKTYLNIHSFKEFQPKVILENSLDNLKESIKNLKGAIKNIEDANENFIEVIK